MYRPNSILVHVGKLSLPLRTILNYVGMTGEFQCMKLVSVLTTETGILKFVLFPLFIMDFLNAKFFYKQILAFHYIFFLLL
jgi:hypothetical protein